MQTLSLRIQKRKKEGRLREKVAISWSGGKDCTLALYEILYSAQYDIYSLHTTFNEDTRRVGLHGINELLIEAQAQSIGITLDKIFVPTAEDHEAYESSMKNYYQNLAELGVKKVVFGDLFLEDLKAFREKMLLSCGLQGIFPLWKKNSRLVAGKFIDLGFNAIICAADANYFEMEAAGSDYNFNFINSLPAEVDPCGENGEFHTFVTSGPIFKTPVAIHHGLHLAKEYHYKINLPDGTSQSRSRKFWFQELNLTRHNNLLA
jgi:uncharacterized protein (TIGR00290 family)